MDINNFLSNIPTQLKGKQYLLPWELTNSLKEVIEDAITALGEGFEITDGIAIHKSVIIENGVTIKRPFVAMENCFIGANAYFREGVFLDRSVKIGPGTEIKNSIICAETSVAHLNYIGNSIIGQKVNFEAGSIAANHFNEREDKRIWIRYNN